MTLEKVEKVDGAFHYFINYDEQSFVIESDKRMSLEEITDRLEEGEYEL